MTHNLGNVEHVVAQYQRQNAKPVAEPRAPRKRPPSTNKTERVGGKAPVEAPQSPTEPASVPHTPDSARFAHAWQLKHAGNNIPQRSSLDMLRETHPVTGVASETTSSRVSQAWQHNQAGRGLPGEGLPGVTDAYRPLPTAQELLNRPQAAKAAPVKPSKQVHSPVVPVSTMKSMPNAGFSQKVHTRRAMPTADELLNGRQQSLAAPVAQPKKPRPLGPTVDLSRYDNPSL